MRRSLALERELLAELSAPAVDAPLRILANIAAEDFRDCAWLATGQDPELPPVQQVSVTADSVAEFMRELDAINAQFRRERGSR